MNHSRWKEPRNLLILLGLVCQGYNLVPWLGALIYGLVWFVCLKLQRERRLISNGMEDALTLLAICGAYLAGQAFSNNALVFIGNGLVVFQAVRLLRPLNLREKKYSIAVALIHLGVGSQYVVDYEFILVLAAAIYLIPRSLFDLEAEKYRQLAAGRHTMLNKPDIAVVVVMMVLFFLFFPRFEFLAQANPITRSLAQQRQQDELDASSGGEEASQLLIFRIEGKDVSYIKESALDQFDGVTWSKSHWMSTPERNLWGNETTGALQRSVKIVNASLIQNNLPVDGYLLKVDGPFVQRPYVADHGGLMVPFELHRNITYTYWTTLDPPAGTLNEKDMARYQKAVPPSPELQNWLNTTLGSETDPEAIGQTLVTHFQSNHEYELGAPDLDRLAPIDDFVLNQRSGHCERFASSMAYLLRLRGIPSRVAMGWLATERNDLGDFYNVRARHGHAWAEAWIEGRGWVVFDGTPNGQGLTMEMRSLGLTIYEWIEFVWYSKIVEFGTTEQTGVFAFVSNQLQDTVTIVLNNLAFLFLVVVLCGLMALGWRWKIWSRWQWKPNLRRRHSLLEAQHFYGKLLRHLAKQRHVRRQGQTPLEFLHHLETEGYPLVTDVRDVTRWFCDIRYGHRELTPDLREAIRQKLARIAKGR